MFRIVLQSFCLISFTSGYSVFHLGFFSLCFVIRIRLLSFLTQFHLYGTLLCNVSIFVYVERFCLYLTPYHTHILEAYCNSRKYKHKHQHTLRKKTKQSGLIKPHIDRINRHISEFNLFTFIVDVNMYIGHSTQHTKSKTNDRKKCKQTENRFFYLWYVNAVVSCFFHYRTRP